MHIRPCSDVITGLTEKVYCKWIVGDLPITATDKSGRSRNLLVRDVRIAEGATDTLLSVHQLWIQQHWDCRFGKHNSVHVVPSDDTFTFCAKTGLYDWNGVLGGPGWSVGDEPQSAAGLKASGGIHRAHSSSHVHNLSAHDAAAVMHRRLHAGASRLCQLPKLCADAPSSLAPASDVSCPSCTEANATHLSHRGSRYQPSYPVSYTAIQWAHSFARAVDITTH
jgi:hypothetical protein